MNSEVLGGAGNHLTFRTMDAGGEGHLEVCFILISSRKAHKGSSVEEGWEQTAGLPCQGF